MKNYVQLYYCQVNDSGVPVGGELGQTPDEALQRAQAFAAPYPSPTIDGPTMVYMLMNKYIAFQIAGLSAYVLDPLHNANIFTQDKDEAEAFGIDSDLWSFNPIDPNQVRAETAAKTNIKDSGKTKVVAPETLLQALQTFLGALVAAGYKFGPRTLITQLVGFIVAVKEGRPFDAVALGILLQKIESALH